MNNLPEVKLGLLVGSSDWLPSDVAVATRKKLFEKYASKYSEDNLYECQVCIVDNELSIKRAVKELTKAECNAVCMCYANYGPESSGTLFAQEFDGPVMLFATAEEGSAPLFRERKDSLSGFINACYALKLRKTNAYIPSNPVGTLDLCVELIHEFIPIAKTMLGVRNLKIISIGPRPSSYLAASAPNHLLYDIGVEISEYSELELLDSFKRHDDDKRIVDKVAEMEQELGESGNTIPEILPRLAQYELTLEDWIRNHKGNRKFIALTSTCWPAFPVDFGFVPCYVNSRITGNRIPIACEVDVYGAVSEYIGQCISNDIVTILNINNNVPESIYNKQIQGQIFGGRSYNISDLFIGYHCGVTSSDLLESCSIGHHFVNNQLIGQEKSKGTIQGNIKPGKVTLFRLQGMRNGRLEAYVAQGQILPVSIETYGGYGIIAIPGMRRFIRNVLLEKQYPNHSVLIRGHHAEKLISVMKQLGVQDVDYNHPLNIPYASENAYSMFTEWY